MKINSIFKILIFLIFLGNGIMVYSQYRIERPLISNDLSGYNRIQGNNGLLNNKPLLKNLSDEFPEPKRYDIINAELPHLIGLEAGPSIGLISGNYSDWKTACDYIFDNGNGMGFFADIIATIPLDYGTNIEFTAGYSSYKVTSSDDKVDQRTVRGEPDPIALNMEANADFELSLLNISASLKQNILIDKLYILAGFRLQNILTAQLEVKEAIKDKGYVFGGSLKGEDYIFPKADIPDKNSMLYSAQVGLLYEMPVFGNYIIAPKVNIIYPFNSMIKDQTFKLININLGIQFLYSY
jgi:hypothetical protein